MKVLITGASGFVGRSLWQHARAAGWEIRATGRRPIASSDYFSHDLAQPLALDFRPDVIFHVAARSSPWGTSSAFTRDNFTATTNVLRFAARAGSPHLVYLSTTAVLYRHAHQENMDETTPPPRTAINPYAHTKLAAEHLVQAYAGPWTILRPRAVFGPGDTVVFPRILRAAQAGRLPWIESDRPVQADLIYIDTLVDYLMRAATLRATGLFHLSNNQPVALLPFLRGLFARLDLPQPTRHWSVARAMRIAAALETVHRVLPFLGEPPLTRFGVSVFAYTKTLNVAKSLRYLGPPSVALSTGVDRFVAWQRQQPKN